ncbi:90 kDa heat shock protein, putative [Entamoeba histolytica HM-1:IMSS-B]|uniref:90 kDa heat shock protein, putative n=6 Tax=Entamoeba histolytica TaxID=5759 RepID=C4M3S9_ENTH1|nr:90 kDa heat shock protein, putative [Entamoeba histolytica HM-1:IMSS]EMD49455.1 endoplasmin precursor, putative [Entamoeba histolytica KU27]EMH77169.1 90 kDa heat shock protein, putative [Entamoeba histolytica HM-1:IMSS-B]EMS15940.1 endoplasmin precursor, putative [Entamoeba histolytica HM-3:IMSS]ENY60611.1 endoplasmin precursor, putative [Entamoeba histolytica HM-1:IMSS-A]GAT95992.1 90 kda heat shock protein putative [Entamoeba histolytica]|eukprot:XP_649964.1 90 kDa heat shock protein, putative [Entamoeba histolytica HM-1:IMSS]
MLVFVTLLLLLLGVSAQEKKNFDVEVSRLMHLIIHSLYTNKEIFLRELISNASDAIDKLRFLCITDKSLNIDPSSFKIRIGIDAAKGSIYIIDNGIGMTKEELGKNLGTIAKSGTAEFIKKLESTEDHKNLIGQFGVGFYSSFLVAENVTVISRKAGLEESYAWESNGEGFVVRELKEDEVPMEEQGTKIILELKDKYFLDINVLKDLVKKYSEFIQFPIEMEITKKEEEEVEDTEAMKQEAQEKAKKRIEEGETSKTEEELIEEELKNVEVKHKFITKNITSWEAINVNKPIWMRSDVTDEEYNQFYKALTKDTKDPLAKIHFNTEGDSVFRALLYIPAEGPNPFAPKDPEKLKQMLRLYVRRVFVSGDFYTTLPDYLTFIRGVIDSDDLPLNVGRELIQENRHIDRIKRKVVRKVLQLIQDLSENNSTVFEAFMKEYSVQMKIGAITDVPNRGRIAKLLRYHSSISGNETMSFQDYIGRLKENQTEIYYVCADSLEEAKNSPVAQSAVNAGYEVIYMTDPVDEAASRSINTFEGKTLVDLGKDGFGVENDDKEYDELKEFIQENIKEISKVEVSNKLGNVAGVVISGKDGLTANMEKLIKAHATANKKDFNLENIKRVLIINGEHDIIIKINMLIKEDKKEQAIEFVKGMYNTALIQSGYTVTDSNEYAQWVQRMIEKELSEIEEVEKKEEKEEKTVGVDDIVNQKNEL